MTQAVEAVNLGFYTYNQNNSGGSFSFDEKAGISHYVIIQARDAIEADYRAQRIGLYFDGSGDCSCCGNRWDEFYGEPTAEPMISNLTLAQWIREAKYFTKWMGPDRPEVFVHLADYRFAGFVYGDADNLRLTQTLELEP